MNYQSLLIANRGEIAVRIMLTAQSMGIKCVAVYVNDDKDSLHEENLYHHLRKPLHILFP